MKDHLMYRREFYIGGEWVKPAGTGVLKVVSPSTEEVVGEVPVATVEDIPAFHDAGLAAQAPDTSCDGFAASAAR
ncbi:hypothetical protein ACWD25_13785, partial [Streptomyces sp. NPDC002920]